MLSEENSSNERGSGTAVRGNPGIAKCLEDDLASLEGLAVSSEPENVGEAHAPGKKGLAIASLAAIGVVFGDIGTSPLYALRECFAGEAHIHVTHENVLGVLSLVVWSLIVVISIKYQGFILKMDNRGEGGILALMALIAPGRHSVEHKRLRIFVLMGLFGSALLYSDGILTPAISVLSAVEGIRQVPQLAHWAEHYVLLITVIILIGLFSFQRRGTARVGAVFGPVTLLWFIVIAVLGLIHIFQAPEVLMAVNPYWGFMFFVHNGFTGFVILGAVFLVVTGGEALYADLGHFGRRPIRAAWFTVVLPALLLNYFGQGAHLLVHPEDRGNPFYSMVPGWGLMPLICLATIATVIASQALISGAFSMGMQAVQMGYSPRMKIDYTSETHAGQIYVPLINWALMLACIGLVLTFKTSSNIAGAYGISITTTMLITTVLFAVVARHRWHWSWFKVALVGIPLLIVDVAFFSANVLKIMHGGWFPIVVAAIIFALMTTWATGRRILGERLKPTMLPIDLFLESIRMSPPVRVKGTAVFMSGSRDGTPLALLHNLKHNKVLHDRILLLTMQTVQIPVVAEKERVTVEALGDGFYRVIANYGFIEKPNAPELLLSVSDAGGRIVIEETTFFIGRETVLSTHRKGMARWRERLFAWMGKNAVSAVDFFGLPPNRVVELGTQVEM